MNIHALETFIKTAELLHFGKASRACNLSPSALTRTIQRLEEEIGQPLFLRDNRSVALTGSGARLLTYARSTVLEWQHFQESLAPEQGASGTLSIYASITAVYSLLPKLLEKYRSAHSAVQLALRTGAAETAMEQVLSGEIDLAIAALPDQKPAQLEFLPLTETPLVFIAPHPLKQIDFSKEPLIVPQSSVARRRLDLWLKQHGIIPRISSEVSGNEALIAMVRLGTGVGIVPQLALERSPLRDEVHVVPNAPRLAPYVVGLCAGKRNLKRPAVQAMWQLAETL
ncbi:MAG: HTH-type transcriptional activator IlvY [Verrucomicrobiota bacterium]